MSLRRFLLGCMVGAAFLAGCAEPPVVRTRAELVRNLGREVAVFGTYGVDQSGEHVRGEEIDVALDVPQDLLGFGRDPISTGSPVRAVGKVERGAMSLGIFLDEETLSRSRGRSEHPTVAGFVLRDAKVTIVKPAAGPVKP